MIQFSINSKELKSKLEVSGKFVSKNPAVPVLENFWFVIKDKVLSITGGDGQNFISTHLPIACTEDLELCVPADKLRSLLSKLPVQEIQFSYNTTVGDTKIFPPIPDTFILYMQHFSGEYELTCEDPVYYIKPPVVKDPKVFSLEREFIKHCSDASKFVPIENYSKFPYTLVRFKGGTLSSVGCDGSNMLQITKPFNHEQDLDLYFAPKTVQTLNSILEADVVMEYNNSHVVFKNEDVHITCRLMDDSKYPDFETMLKGYTSNISHEVIIDSGSLLSSLERLNIYVSGITDNSAATLTLFQEDMSITAEESVNNTTGSELVSLEDSLGPSQEQIVHTFSLKTFSLVLKDFCYSKGAVSFSLSNNCILLRDFQSESEYKRICLSMGLAKKS